MDLFLKAAIAEARLGLAGRGHHPRDGDSNAPTTCSCSPSSLAMARS